MGKGRYGFTGFRPAGDNAAVSGQILVLVTGIIVGEEEDDFNKFVRETREASGIQPPKHENCISVFTIGTLEDKTHLHWHGDHPYIYTYRRETGSIEAALLS